MMIKFSIAHHRRMDHHQSSTADRLAAAESQVAALNIPPRLETAWAANQALLAKLPNVTDLLSPDLNADMKRELVRSVLPEL